MTKQMTKGNETKLILLFTLPIMAGNFLQQLYNTADSVIVGWFVSETALGAVGTCTPLTMLFIALALGLSTGSSILVSQYYGANRTEDMRASISTVLILVVALGVVLTVVGVLTSEVLLKYVLAVPEESLELANTYFKFYCMGIVFQFTYNIVAALLRSVGDSKATLYFLLVSSVLNIGLDLLFVIVFGWGVAGAAVATVISQCAAAVISLVYMFRKYPIMRFTREEFKFHKDKCSLALKMGIPSTIQQCVVSMGHIAIQRVINSFGVDMMSACTAAARIENYILIPIFGFQAGVATFTGQNVGAGEFDRVKRGYKKTILMAFVTCVLVAALIVFGAEWLVRLFSLSGRSLELGVEYLTSVTPFFIIFGIYMITGALLQGSGDVIYAMMCTLISLFIRIICCYVMAYLTPVSYRAIWWAMPIGWAVACVMAIIRMRQGKWKEKRIVHD